MNARWGTQLEILGAKVCHLLNPSSGVVQKQQERSITQGETSFGREIRKKHVDLLAFQVTGFGWGYSLGRNSRYALGLNECLRRSSREILKERAQRGQTLISGSDVVLALLFEHFQKAHNPITC
jgi:hypothetical protein